MSAFADGRSTAGSTPASHLVKYQWKPGQRPPGAGKPKGLASLRRRFRDAFAEKPRGDAESLADVVLKLARGKIVRMERTFEDGEAKWEWAYIDSKTQMAAIQFVAEYGFGPPPKALDDETSHKLALDIIKGMLGEARARHAATRTPEVPAAVPTAATGGAE